jgi:hypothetical protein
MHIPELMPEIAVLQRGPVHQLNVFSAGECFQYGEVAGARLVEARQQTI